MNPFQVACLSFFLVAASIIFHSYISKNISKISNIMLIVDTISVGIFSFLMEEDDYDNEIIEYLQFASCYLLNFILLVLLLDKFITKDKKILFATCLFSIILSFALPHDILTFYIIRSVCVFIYIVVLTIEKEWYNVCLIIIAYACIITLKLLTDHYEDQKKVYHTLFIISSALFICLSYFIVEKR